MAKLINTDDIYSKKPKKETHYLLYKDLNWYERLRLKARYKKKKRLNRSKLGDFVLLLMLLGFGFFSAYPLIFTILNSFKPLDELFIFPPKLIPQFPTLNNYFDLFSLVDNSIIPFTRYLFNTLFITVMGTFGHVLLASLCAYPLAKYNFPFKKIIFALVIYSLMFSSTVTAIPNYVIVSKIGLIDTQWALILPAFAYSLGLYLMKQFMETIPNELIEAAKIDGAGEFRVFFTVAMPLVKPAWLTLIILLFQQLWGNDGGRFIYTENLKPLSYALGQIVSGGVARTGAAAAVSVIMLIVPICVFIVSQSRIIETMAHSGMK